MAIMTVNSGQEFIKKISQLGAKSEAIGKKVVAAGASPIADEIRKNLEANLADPSYAGVGDKGSFAFIKKESTGDLLNSFGISPALMDDNGNINSKIGFAGYDRKGVPNALKARAMESGTSALRKRPFVRPAVNAKRKKARQAMEAEFDRQVKIYAL